MWKVDGYFSRGRLQLESVRAESMDHVRNNTFEY